MADALILALVMFPGVVILLRLAARAISLERMRKVAAKTVSIHERANGWILKRNLLHFPGACLVTSLRGWISGELVFIAAFVLAVTAELSLLEAALVIFCGWIAAVIALVVSFREEARRKMDDLRSTLPVASFLMSLMLEAGMGSAAALQEVAGALPRGPLAAELDDIARSRRIGVTRAEAIDRSRNRVPLDDYRSFLNLIQQGERLGIALSQGLRELSSRMMESQAHRAETMAQKAAVKLLFPLVIFIFPSVFLIILSPVILNLLDLLGR